MSRRSRRGFINTQEVLEKLSFGRAGAVQVMRSAKIGSPQYRTAMHLSEAVDDMVEKLTGDRTHCKGCAAHTLTELVYSRFCSLQRRGRGSHAPASEINVFQ